MTLARVLVDASGLIAMARIGHLSLLHELLGPIHTTQAVVAEATEPDEPGAATIDAMVESGEIMVAPLAEEQEEEARSLATHGLGRGEASLIAACTAKDTLLLDDATARRVAQARGLRFTGLLGVLVAGVEGGRLGAEEGVEVVRALARSDFRMTVELYDWARERMEAEGISRSL